ncbi:MAG: hypothetical protein KF760_06685 [Candidatus Eremiobacteraeota bacterium]|nr:hypothetical protein [Candidatus Eremiobacteraeota bacterium]MCW5866056.1 hypothetical protein [Candidatus Eremiobacteraeota bacterium]
MIALRAFYCPCCGARLDPPGSRRVQCAYCDAQLQAEPEFISESQPQRNEFSSRLSQNRTGRFEMSWLHQRVCEHELDLLHFEPLGPKHSALIYLRRCDGDGRSQAGSLPLQPVLESLRAYRDPGLAAHQALEWLCEQPQGFSHKLECAICLFDEERSRATVYSAGCRETIYWLSNEQASVTDLAGYQGPLERKMLAEERDNFSNGRSCELAAMDAVVIVSAGYAGRGDGPYASGTSVLVQELRELLGEDPLRLVTLAKNAFWEKRSPAAYEQDPSNSLHVVAVQTRPNQVRSPAAAFPLQSLGTVTFELACWSGPDDFLELLPLHDERQVLVWASNDGLPWTPEHSDLLRSAVLEVLDRPQHGDNENPRVAGRLAQQRLPLTRLVIIQCFDRYRRVKYYRVHNPHPIFLAPRQGQHGSNIMAYDEGGEATLDPGARLLFLGCSSVGQPLSMNDLAGVWPGGKASALHLSLTKLWTTPPSQAALQKVLGAVVSDGVRTEPGYFLVTSRPE